MAARDRGEDNQGDSKVAIKKLENVFWDKIFLHKTLRDLKIMRLLSHDNVLKLKNILNPGSIEKFNELYVITELMDTNLSQIIISK